MSHAVIALPHIVNHFLNLCISYCIGPVGGFEQEELVDLQAPSFEETNPGSQQGKP
jgi:hypothetical protein